MSKKSPAKKGRKSNNKHSNFDWSSVYPSGRIKSQIQAVDADIGCLPQKSLELINASSMLLLKKVVKASSSDTTILSAKDIQHGIQNESSLAFLGESVDDAVKSETNKLAKKPIYKPKKSTAKRKAQEELGVSRECLDQAAHVANQESTVNPDKIDVDDEEYDWLMRMDAVRLEIEEITSWRKTWRTFVCWKENESAASCNYLGCERRRKFRIVSISLVETLKSKNALTIVLVKLRYSMQYKTKCIRHGLLISPDLLFRQQLRHDHSAT